MEHFAKRRGDHVGVIEGVLHSVALYLKNPNNFVAKLPRHLKLPLNSKSTSAEIIVCLAKYMIEQTENDLYVPDENFICRGEASDYVKHKFKYIYQFSLDGGNTSKCVDYRYVLKTYMQHVGKGEGCLFLDRHELPSDVYNTLLDISKEIN